MPQPAILPTVSPSLQPSADKLLSITERSVWRVLMSGQREGNVLCACEVKRVNEDQKVASGPHD